MLWNIPDRSRCDIHLDAIFSRMIDCNSDPGLSFGSQPKFALYVTLYAIYGRWQRNLAPLLRCLH